jgi:hypothetical protein
MISAKKARLAVYACEFARIMGVSSSVRYNQRILYGITQVQSERQFESVFPRRVQPRLYLLPVVSFR